MITLAFDSTARAASVAVTDSDRLLGLYNIDNGLTQSELLLPMAEDLLRSLKLSFSDVELLAASVGPGSFTGVRIGTALVKGIAFGKGIPCASVSTLRALAENLRGIEGIIVPVMDARRSQVYTAIFRYKDGDLSRLTEDLAISIDELSRMLAEFSGWPVYLVGDGYRVAAAGISKNGIDLRETPELLRCENAYSVARVAVQMHNEGKTVSDSEHLPTYLRVPQAERERLERLNNVQKN
ncbi:MAG: tRNA (adenosine(37)-N6)-threonylcarbamoyltransferase complex dimerization subunit type 1 TsaB [Ruminococcaceae bacterium]|nr:tRNA (adenosine(37)-N6)-threonylcarbamoyltransferase complex dimerization subunit type 1 TsaB [Oscillospiraceae bacterium]